MRNCRFMRRDRANLPPEEEAVGLIIDLGKEVRLKSILRRCGHFKEGGRRCVELRVRFRKEEKEEWGEGVGGVYVGACHEGSVACS